MSSRAKLILQMALQSHETQSSNLVELNEIHTTSLEEDVSPGYIELTPIKILPKNVNETVPTFLQDESCYQILSPMTTALNNDGHLQNYILQDKTENSYNHSDNNYEQEQVMDSHFINRDNVLVSAENTNAEVQPSDAGDKNYETESSFDSDDSTVNLKVNRAKKRNSILEWNNSNEIAETETGCEHALKKKSRKRPRQKDKWKRNEKKQKRNAGEAYTTILKDKPVPQRQLKRPCDDSCRYKCFAVFSQEERETILRSFWKIGDNTRQRQFIASYVDTVLPKYRYPKENTNRSTNYSYFLTKNKEKIRVCKKFFMATLDIGDTMIRTTLKKISDSGIVEEDRRGKHKNHKTVQPSLRDGVRNHIDSIPRVESHYLRNQTTREYFEGDLNISTLYRLYKEKCIETDVSYVKKCIYEQVFNTEYNIGFFKPKKDQCSTCETYKNSNEEEQQALEDTYRKHIKNKELSREEKTRDVKIASEENNKMVAVYDLEAVLPTPCGDVSTFYYKSKLATYNFTIFDIVPKQGYCYVWSENCAKRGANEIGTCIFSFLQEFCDGKDVTFYSDNCAGQNKNKFIAAMYMHAVSNLNIPSITHKFLITGHTQNEGDSMHSCIEREKKRVLKSGPIYVPAQCIPVIRLAKKNGKPYKVFEIDTFDIFDFKKLSTDIGCNYSLNTNNEKVMWNDIKILSFNKDTPCSIFYKYEYDQNNYSEIDIRGRRSTRNNHSSLTKAYKEAPKISKNKKEGLLFLCKTKAIKRPYHSFYKNLPCEN